MKIAAAANVNGYISMFPKYAQKVLEQVRDTIKKLYLHLKKHKLCNAGL